MHIAAHVTQQSEYESPLLKLLRILIVKYPEHKFTFFVETILEDLPKNCTQVILSPKPKNNFLLYFWYKFKVHSYLKIRHRMVFISEFGLLCEQSPIPQYLFFKEEDFWQDSNPVFKSAFVSALAKANKIITTQTFLAESLSKLKQPPKTFFCGSAIGYYGNHPAHEIIDEGGANGHGFLGDVTREWENATNPAEMSGIRVIHMRTGVVLDKKSGALAKMLPPFYLGLGGPIGSGEQVMSWIALAEIPSIINFLTEKSTVSGPVNFTAPQPVTSRDFAKVLGNVLHRPAFLPLPEFVVKTLFGEMGKELLLGGAHVTPRRLIESGYVFTYPDLKSALISILRPLR